MNALYDQNAPKKATNLSVNSDLMEKARGMNINLSATLEQALKEQLAQKASEQWKAENKVAFFAGVGMEGQHQRVTPNSSTTRSL